MRDRGNSVLAARGEAWVSWTAALAGGVGLDNFTWKNDAVVNLKNFT